MKYIADMGDGKYIANMFWFSDTSPIVTLKSSSKENAVLFDSKDKEEAIKSKYPTVTFVPIKFSIDLEQ